jgi:choline dehydrogenase-like flavoprotein
VAGASATGETFDYIVVGAGTAGCVVAARLAENPASRVCLVEAGPRDSHPFIHIPATVGAAIATRAINWGFLTTPQPGLANRRIPIPRGHVVGGSGSINGMVYFRGQPADYEDWVAAGNPGWSFREVLPYFLRSERNAYYAGSPYHATDGPMNVKFVDRPNSMTSAFLAAMATLGYPACEDFNGPNPEGYGLRQGTIRDGRRVSTATAYLEPAVTRSNLAVLTDALVERVAFDGRRAVGVDLRRGGVRRRLAARAEIVICGGAINSPQILMLSGVGDGAHLRELGIEVVHDLPAVGANLHDHLAAAVLMEMRNTASYGISLRTLPRAAWNLLEYAAGRRGPLASNVFESTAFLRTTSGLSRPDVQIVFQTARRNRSTFPFPLGHGFAFSAVNLYPRSRGRIRLASPDPSAHPDIDPNLLGDPADVAPLVRGIRLGRQIARSAAFARYRAREVQPGPQAEDDASIVDYIRRASGTVHHPVGTCRMSGTDPRSVVDAQLRVRGVEALRVVDASVFPSIVGGNTNAATVMVAERGADMLLGRPQLPAFEG